MSADQALEMMRHLLQIAMLVAGPILLASLSAGLAVGVVQAATQINEASVSFVVKVGAVVAVLVAIGPALAASVVDYTRASFASIEHVVH